MTAIRSFNHIYPKIPDSTYIDTMATVIGDVILGNHCSVWPGAVIRGDVHHIRIGDQTNIQEGAILHVTHASQYEPKGYPLILGNHITIGHLACLHGCRVEDRVLIGIGAKVLDGAIIESNTLVAAGSLVPPGKTLASGYLWMGAPVKSIRALTDEEKAFLIYSAEHYVTLKNIYLQQYQQDHAIKTSNHS